MNQRIFNRASTESQPQNGWIHIIPKGEVRNDEAGIIQVLDNEALNSIKADLDQKSKAEGLYGGREHFIYDPEQDSAALAWFKNFQLRDDGIWANVDGLTPEGQKAVADQAYKFTSMVFSKNDMSRLSDAPDGTPRYRALAIETVGFTNLPVARDLLAPISNRSTSSPNVPQGTMSARLARPANFHAGSQIFNRIVEMVRDRTGRNFHDAFNLVLRDNRDLFMPTYKGQDPTKEPVGDSMPFLRLCNRMSKATGLGPCDVQDRLVQKINRVADEFFPMLNREPGALKWDAVLRAANVMAGLGTGHKIMNRPDGVTQQDRNAANKTAGDVLDFLETKEDQLQDFGHSSTFQAWNNAGKIRCFRLQIRRLGTEQGMTIDQAMDYLKENQPVFWAGCMLAFRDGQKK